MATDETTFFQFPLCLLGMPEAPEKAQVIMSYALAETGIRAAAEMGMAELRDAVNTIPSADLPAGMRKTDAQHLALALGNKIIGVTKGAVSGAFAAHRECKDYAAAFTARHGGDAVCRMRKDLLFDVRDGRMTWRDFSTLAAVYSIIGGKPFPVLVYRSMIQARQLGCKSPSVLEAEQGRRNNLVPLTEKQVRNTLDNLECAGWFARVQASPRKVYFSHRLTREEMIQRLEVSAAAQGRANRNRNQDKRTMARLAKLKSGAEK
jgi:hypothetical protein